MAIERREYKGAAVTAKITGAITAADTAFAIDATSGWPTGAVGPFIVVIDKGLSTEEKIKCASRSGSTVSVASGGRGFDNTTAQAHAASAVVKHTLSATDLDIVNDHASTTTRDDHTQYMHNTVARTVSAAHTHNGAEIHNGAEVHNGTEVFTAAPTMPAAAYGGTGDMTALTINSSPSAGVSPKHMRADARLALPKSTVLRSVWDVGDFKLTALTSAVDTTEWLECNGQAVSRSTYAALFTAIGTTYGAGDGSSTFNVPDFRDYMISGAGTGGTRAIGATGGADSVTLATANLPAHNHAVTDPGHAHGASSAVTDPGHTHSVAGGDFGFRIAVTVSSSVYNMPGTGAQAISFTSIDPHTTGVTVATTVNSATTGISTQNTGSGTAVATVPKWRGVRVLIKAA